MIIFSGITRIQTEGQSSSIYQDIVGLIETCVKHASAIVLHVIPLSTNFTTSDSIRICQRHDPQCSKLFSFDCRKFFIDFVFL